jgi:hypothetical protein
MAPRERQFELRVFAHGKEGYGLALYQTRPGRRRRGEREMERLVQVAGDPLRAVMDQVLGALRRAGYRPSELQRGRCEPFGLLDEDGTRLGLLLLIIRPIRKLDRIEAIHEGLRRMEPEEVYYWFSKATARDGAERARRALRILLADE